MRRTITLEPAMMTILACLALAFALLSSITVPVGRLPMMPVCEAPGAVLPLSLAREMRDAVGRTSDGLCGALFADELQAEASADRVRYALSRIPMPHAFRVDLSGRILV